jgi:rRNA maturation RNase YbeY
LGSTDAELSVSLVDDDAIARLAGDFGRRRRATDVLAFAQREGRGRGARVGCPRDPPTRECLGDVVISLDTARRQASRRGIPLDRELRTLLIHGCLHLHGLDHLRPGDRARMRALERHLAWELARFD